MSAAAVVAKLGADDGILSSRVLTTTPHDFWVLSAIRKLTHWN
jgi:hypothetical protein